MFCSWQKNTFISQCWQSRTLPPWKGPAPIPPPSHGFSRSHPLCLTPRTAPPPTPPSHITTIPSLLYHPVLYKTTRLISLQHTTVRTKCGARGGRGVGGPSAWRWWITSPPLCQRTVSPPFASPPLSYPSASWRTQHKDMATARITWCTRARIAAGSLAFSNF